MPPPSQVPFGRERVHCRGARATSTNNLAIVGRPWPVGALTVAAGESYPKTRGPRHRIWAQDRSQSILWAQGGAGGAGSESPCGVLYVHLPYGACLILSFCSGNVYMAAERWTLFISTLVLMFELLFARGKNSACESVRLTTPYTTTLRPRLPVTAQKGILCHKFGTYLASAG